MLRLFILTAMLGNAMPAYAVTADAALRESKALAVQERYDEALAVLEEAHKDHPEDAELKLAIIRTLSWKGDYKAAEEKLSALGKPYDENADARLLRANLAYYRGDYETAEANYRAILVTYPDYEDAKTGLESVLKAQAASAEEKAPGRWQLDTGYEYSDFSRREQSSWNQQFVQATHFLDGRRRTAVHAKATRYDQFDTIDAEYEAGVDHRFTGFLTGYAYGAISPAADFRPEHRFAGGGMLRVINAEDAMPLWLTLDARYDVYDAVKVNNVNPGLRIEPWDGWTLWVRKIVVDADDAGRVYGEDYRLDGTLMEGVRFYAGYADAPETVAGITVDTQTWFGGLAWDVTEEVTLRLGYARDDRENSYIRDVVNVSASYRF
jgi:YaiO family outer membrane protein